MSDVWIPSTISGAGAAVAVYFVLNARSMLDSSFDSHILCSLRMTVLVSAYKAAA